MLLKRFARLINWESFNFEVKGLFFSGEEALDFLHIEHVDVVFSDVRMPNISGIDIAEYVSKNLPHTKVVLISGYSDFDHAQKAIQHGVFNYILKPYKTSEIEDCLRKLNIALKKEKMLDPELLDLLRRQLFHELYFGLHTDQASVLKKLEALSLDAKLLHAPCVYINITMENPSEYLTNETHSPENMITLCINLLKSLNLGSDEIYLINFTKNTFEFVVFYQDGADISENRIIELQTELTIMAKEILNLNIKALLKKHTSICSAAADNCSSTPQTAIISLEQMLLDNLLTANANGFHSTASAYFNIIRTQSPERRQRQMIHLFGFINNALPDFTDKLDIARLQSNPSVEACEKYFTEFSLHIMEIDCSLIENAKKYIHENCSKQITLSDVAKHVCLSSVYFCTLFKEKTGVNFNKYLTEIRMEKAMELLSGTDLKIYVICSMVGYKTQKYFTKLFKNHTGLLPIEYRNKHRI